MLHAGVATRNSWRRLHTQVNVFKRFERGQTKSVASQLRRVGAVYAGSLHLKLSLDSLSPGAHLAKRSASTML